MSNTVRYDQNGNPVVVQAGARQPHRFQQGIGDNCLYCNLERFTASHFNGDSGLAYQAQLQYHETVKARIEWQDHLKAGDRVQIRDAHPREDLRGLTGTVKQMTRTAGGRMPNSKTELAAVIKFTAPTSHMIQGLTIPVRFLQVPELAEETEVPKFATQEEADKWLEDRAKEMGIVDPRDTPRFQTQEEADEWLRQQAGEPYVPPSWIDSLIQTGRAQDAARGSVQSFLDQLVGMQVITPNQMINIVDPGGV